MVQAGNLGEGCCCPDHTDRSPKHENDYCAGCGEDMVIQSDGNSFICSLSYYPRNEDDEDEDLNAPTPDVICCEKAS